MGIGVWELLLILVVVVLMFGTGKLTRAMGDLARGVRGFREEMKDVPAESDDTGPVAAAPPAPKALPAPDPIAVGRSDQPARL